MVKILVIRVSNFPEGDKNFYIATLYHLYRGEEVYIISSKGEGLDSVMSSIYSEVGRIARDFTSRGFEVKIIER